MKLNYKPIGKYIQEVKVRNKNNETNNLLGININKYYMPSVANIVGTDLSVYKIVKKGQFACNRMHIGRDMRLPVALSLNQDDFIVSPAYDVFEIIDTTVLLPEYLMMWFTRSEFDRNAWFYTDADVRGGLNWKSFCEMQLPIPSPTKQKEIVAEYNTIQDRIDLNKQLIQKLEETAQAIYREWFEKRIDRENLPEGWKIGAISDLCDFTKERVSIKCLDLDNYISTENMLQEKAGIISANSLPSGLNVASFEIGNILISNIRPYLKKIWLANVNGGCSNDVLCFVPKANVPSLYLYQILEKDTFFEYVMAGSKGTKMPRGDKKWIMNFPVIIPNKKLQNKFHLVSETIEHNMSIRKEENQKLSELRDLILSKLAGKN